MGNVFENKIKLTNKIAIAVIRINARAAAFRAFESVKKSLLNELSYKFIGYIITSCSSWSQNYH